MGNAKAADQKALRDAAAHAVDFNPSRFKSHLVAMGQSGLSEAEAKKIRESSLRSICIEAVLMRRAELVRDGGTRDNSVIVDAFTDNFDTFRAVLAAEGSTLVKTTDKGKVIWTGHGANVKTIAKGCVEFDQQDGFIDVESAETFKLIKESVQDFRADAESAEAKALRAAKEDYRKLEANIRKQALGRKDAEAVEALTVTMGLAFILLMDHPEAIHGQLQKLQETLDAEAEAMAKLIEEAEQEASKQSDTAAANG